MKEMKNLMPLPLLLALRFLRSSGQEKNISTLVGICFFSILIGTCALTLIAAIMNGFEQATSDKLQGVHADITINAGDQAIDYPKLKKVLMAEYATTIKAMSPTSIRQIILHAHADKKSRKHGSSKVPDEARSANTESGSETASLSDEYTICLLKVIEPQEESGVTGLRSMIIDAPQAQAWSLLDNNGIFIGQALAQRLHIAVGDTVSLLYPEEEQFNRKISLDEKEVKVAALFKTGIADFDEQVLITSFAVARQLYPTCVSSVTVMLHDSRREQSVIASLKQRLSLDVTSWKEMYPGLVSALILEKYAMFFILALVILISSLNTISLLYMYVTQKRRDIALLKAMGMADRSLMTIFIIVASLITGFATLCGIGIAALITAFLNKFPFIQLPDVYYASHLPATLNGMIVVAVMLLALLVSIGAALFQLAK